MMKTPKFTVIDATPDLLDPLVKTLPMRNFQGLARFLQQSNRNECDFLIATSDNHPVGYCLVYWASEFPKFNAENIPEIVDLIISENYRRQGVASAILDEIEQRLINHSHTKVGLTVHIDNTNAYALYKKKGYAVIDKVKNTNLILLKNLLT